MGLFGENENKTIDDYAEEGNSFFDLGKYDDAIDIWKLGLDAVSDPENAQSESVWFQTSIADAYFMQDKFSEAYDFLFEAKSNLSGEGYNNPFVMLRLGQCAYELKKEEYKEYLLRAYILAGEEIFEADDEKYFESIKDLL